MTEPTNPNLPPGWGVPKNLVFDKELPSGAKVRLRKLEISDLIELGLIDQLDTFSPEAIAVVGEAPKEKTEQEDKAEYGKKLIGLFEMVDKVVVASLIDPKILPKPKDVNAPREEGLYVDGIPSEDKMSIFEDAAEDMSSFLGVGEGQKSDVGTVEASPVVPHNPEPVVGAPGG